MAFLEYRDECRLVYQNAPSDVHQRGALRHGGEVIRTDHLLRLGCVWCGQHQEVGPGEELRQPFRAVEFVRVHGRGIGPAWVPFDAQHPHAEGPGHAAHLLAHRAVTDDQHRPAFQVRTGKPLPVFGSLCVDHGEHASYVPEHAHDGELCEGAGVHTAGRCERRLRHARRVSHAAHELSDAGAGRLDPPDSGRDLGKVLEVGLVEVEENGGPGHMGSPAGFLFIAALDLPALVVRGVARRAEEGGLVDDLGPGGSVADARDVLVFQPARDEDDLVHVYPPKTPRMTCAMKYPA